MITVLFGKINSRKKFTNKIVITEDLSKVYVYEKKSKRWEFVTHDINSVDYDNDRFRQVKECLLGNLSVEKKLEILKND